MSYEIVISKGYRWADDNSFTKIKLSEWRKVIKDLGLVPVDQAKGVNPLTKEALHVVLQHTHGAPGDRVLPSAGVMVTT